MATFNSHDLATFSCASVDNHIPRDDIFDYHPLRDCNIYILLLKALSQYSNCWLRKLPCPLDASMMTHILN